MSSGLVDTLDRKIATLKAENESLKNTIYLEGINKTQLEEQNSSYRDENESLKQRIAELDEYTGCPD